MWPFSKAIEEGIKEGIERSSLKDVIGGLIKETQQTTLNNVLDLLADQFDKHPEVVVKRKDVALYLRNLKAAMAKRDW